MMNNVEMIWGTPILDEGFANVPNMIIRNYKKLGMTHAEFGLIMQLITYKHDDGDPFPSQETLADHMETSARHIRSILSSLEKKELIEVEFRYIDGKRSSNVYILKPMIDKCLELKGEEPLPETKERNIKRAKKKKKTLPEQKLPEVNTPDLPEENVPVEMTQNVPELPEENVPSNNTREYNKVNRTNEYHNQSITEQDIENMNLPIPIKQTLIKNRKRLIDDDIGLRDITSLYKTYASKVDEYSFSQVLSNVLSKTKGTIRNLGAILYASIKNQKKTPQGPENDEIQDDTTYEVQEDWFKEQRKKSNEILPDNYRNWDIGQNKPQQPDEDISQDELKSMIETLQAGANKQDVS